MSELSLKDKIRLHLAREAKWRGASEAELLVDLMQGCPAQARGAESYLDALERQGHLEHALAYVRQHIRY